MFGGSYFGRALFGGDRSAAIVASVLTCAGLGTAAWVGRATITGTQSAAGTSSASFVGVAVQGLFAMTGAGTFTPRALTAFAMVGVGAFDARGEIVGAFKPAWASNSNRVFGPPSPETT